jgi:hypothetical protein
VRTVTIRTKGADVPSEFPPARLFLDDIDEIVRILVEATENRKEEWNRFNRDAKTRVTLTIKDQVCDEVQELPKIAIKTIGLSVRVEIQKSLPQTFLTFNRYSTSLRLDGFTREQELSIYHNLAPIFKRRNLWLATLVRSLRTLILTLMVLFTLVDITLTLMFKKQTPRTLVTVIELLTVAIGTTFVATTWHHSIINLRHSSEPSAFRQDLLQKIFLVVLTFLLTLLGFYLKHKYWP